MRQPAPDTCMSHAACLWFARQLKNNKNEILRTVDVELSSMLWQGCPQYTDVNLASIVDSQREFHGHAVHVVKAVVGLSIY